MNSITGEVAISKRQLYILDIQMNLSFNSIIDIVTLLPVYFYPIIISG